MPLEVPLPGGWEWDQAPELRRSQTTSSCYEGELKAGEIEV